MVVQYEFELEIKSEEHHYTYSEGKRMWAKGEPDLPVPDILLSASVTNAGINLLHAFQNQFK